MAKNRVQKLRTDAGLTAAALARQLGVAGHTFRRWDRGETNPPPEMSQRIADRFNVTRDYVDGIGSDIPQAVVQPGKTIPVHGKAEGGDGVGNFGQDPIDRLDIAGLADGDGVYAIMMHGESMEPRFLAGELLIVNPDRPPRRGDYVVVQYESGSDTLAIAKQYVRRTGDTLTLHQHNPDEEITLPAQDVRAVHYIQAVRAI